MSLIVQNSRTLLKRSQISGATPTVKTGSTQHTDGTWVDTEIYPGEIYWNMQDRIMYIGWEDISGNTGTDVLVTGAGTGSCVSDFYTENVFPCNNLLNLQVTDGINYDNNINISDNTTLGINFTSTDLTTSDFTLIELLGASTSLLTDNGTTQHRITMDSNNGLIPFELRTDNAVNSSTITLSPNFVSIQGNLALTRATLGISVGEYSPGVPETIDFSRGSGNRLTYDLSGNSTTAATSIAIGVIDFSGTTPDKVITVNANVGGIDKVGNQAYGSKLFAVFKNIAGAITQIGTTDKIERRDFTTATSDITISGTNIIIQVTGEAATTINWLTDFSYHITPGL